MTNYMRRVLIVGANSYIGNSLEQYIEKNKDHFQNELTIDKVSASNDEWKSKDFVNYDVILHLAGIAHVKETKEREVTYYKVNRDLTIEVAKKAKRSKVKQFIFMSSASVYGSKATVITKDTIPQPDTYYGKSKLQAEEEIIKMQDSDFHIAIVRPPIVYGPGCKGNFPRLVKLAKVMPIFPDIMNQRSMIYIDNLCEFIRLLIEEEGSGYYHPQNGEYVCTSEMVKMMGECLGKKIYFTKLMNWLIWALRRRVGVINKVFGDWYYEVDENEVLQNKIIRYQVGSFNRSIINSVVDKC